MKTLIVYATKHGTAEKCARLLSEKLAGEVDLCNLKEKKDVDLSSYSSVVIGGSIYAGTMHKEIKEFCTINLNALKNKKVGLFICCMNKNSAELQLKSAFSGELQDAAVVKENFGGEFKFKEMNFMERFITKMVTKSLAKTDKSIPAVDGKTDLSFIFEENIKSFAELMNKAV